MDQVLIKDLLARGVIGLSEKERSRPQDILINIIMDTDVNAAITSDSVQDCVDYSEMTKAVFDLVEKNQRYTVEALAGDIAALCLDHPLVTAARVRVEKTSAVRFVQSVGVEIFRSKPGRSGTNRPA